MAQTQQIEELAERRRKWVEANRENGFETGLKRLLTDLYPDNAHFIYELLQNAEDAHAQEVRFILHEDRLEFEHDGARLFSIQDVDAITSIGFSTKRDDTTKIGKFGVGFKAVFAFTDSPEIESGGFYFRIRDMVVPESVGHLKKQSLHKQTRFVLPFNNPRKPSERAYNEIVTLLRELDATTLLFLMHISKIEYLLPDSSLGYVERITHGDNRFEICVQQPSEQAPSSAFFLKFDNNVQVEDEEAENEDHRLKSCRIAVAFGLSRSEPKTGGKKKDANDEEDRPGWELAPVDPGRVCIYFPADKETSNLYFHLHAPFASTVARDSVRDCAGNNALRDHLAELLAGSMLAIRNQDLLTVRTLALLPNDKDNLPKFYKPIMERLVREFREQDLVPMKRGGHAVASRVFRSTRALSDLVDDDDMVMLLGDGYAAPIWVSNPPQRNQREDNLLSMLHIEQWDAAELVKALGRMNKNVLGQWMGGKGEPWHQILYEILMDYLNAVPKHPSAAAAERKGTITGIGLVRCSDGTYRKGSDCFFPTGGVECDEQFPRVAKGVYFSGKEENKKARSFLKTLDVREVNEQVEIEYALKKRYSQEAVDKKSFKPELNDMPRFIGFAEKHPDDIKMFKGFFIFQLKDKRWAKPSSVYLDAPFLETGLNIYYQILGGQSAPWALSEEYASSKFNPKKVGEFAKKVGAITDLSVRKIDWSNGVDYTIERLDALLASKNIGASKLVWRTLASHENGYNSPDFYYQLARPDRRYNFSFDGDSSIIAALKKSTWVPQKTDKTIEFVHPRDAVAEKLPEGFEYQTGWQWLKILDFGKGVEEQREAQRREKDRQTKEYKHKEEVARKMGFESPEEAEEIARLKKENPDGFRKFKEDTSALKEHPTFPTRSMANPERRRERLAEQLSDAPDKEYEKRERSVRTTNGAIDPITWLRNQYTNEADQMVCQICKEEMPFRKRDGAHYFEKKEVLSRKYLPKEHEAQYLALCPLCAAKYDEFVKTDDDVMAKLREEIVSAEDCEIPISLGDEKTTIRFVETHYQDIKSILEEMG